MYTRCSECGTVFRLTATVLQMAEGAVCCGNCGATFNALEALYDAPPPAQVPGMAPAAAEAAAEPGDESLEFDVPEQEWNRFFTDTLVSLPESERVAPELGAGFEDLGEPAPDGIPQDSSLEPVLVEPANDEPQAVAAAFDEIEDATEAGDERAAAEDFDAPPVSPTAEQPRLEPAADDEPQPGTVLIADPPAAAGTASANRPGTVLDWGVPDQLMQPAAAEPRRVAIWVLGSIVAALALAVQIVHYNRDTLAADMRYGRWVRLTYNRLNMPLYPAWPLDAYEIRGAEAIAGRTAAGTLDVVAQIAVKGHQPVGLPMVRVVLRDRWSKTIGSRVLGAGEFLPQPQSPSRTYPPGAVIPVLISIADPGPTAQGYELDVCRPDRHRGLLCQSSGDPFRRSD